MSTRQGWWQLQEPFVAERLADMVEDSGITDAEPGMWAMATEGGTEFFVESRSRGRVKVGFLSHAEVNENLGRVLVPHVEELEAAVDGRTKKATAQRISAKSRNIERARELRSNGLSYAQIAVKMTEERNARRLPEDRPLPDIHTRTVENWIKEPTV